MTVKIGAELFLVMMMNQDDEWEVESIHATNLGAELKITKIAKENNYDRLEIDRWLIIETKQLQK